MAQPDIDDALGNPRVDTDRLDRMTQAVDREAVHPTDPQAQTLEEAFEALVQLASADKERIVARQLAALAPLEELLDHDPLVKSSLTDERFSQHLSTAQPDRRIDFFHDFA